jgi:hypothetical protein
MNMGISAAPVIPRRQRESELPLSFAQERLWFLDALGAGSSYHLPISQRRRRPFLSEAPELF